MRTLLLALALLAPAALVGALASHAAACATNPSTTFTITNPTLITVIVGAGTGGSGRCVAAEYYLGNAFSCPYDPFSLTVGGFTVSVPPVTVTVNPLLGVSQSSFVCDKRVEILP